MDKFLEFVTKLFEVILNRKLMALIGGISALLFIVFYFLVPPALAIAGMIKYSFVFGCLGAFGLLVHFGFDIDEHLKHKQAAKESEKQNEMEYEELENRVRLLWEDQLAILIRFADGGKSTEYFNVADGKSAHLARQGFLYTPSGFGTPVATQAYCLTPMAAKMIRSGRFQKILTEMASTRQPF